MAIILLFSWLVGFANADQLAYGKVPKSERADRHNGDVDDVVAARHHHGGWKLLESSEPYQYHFTPVITLWTQSNKSGLSLRHQHDRGTVRRLLSR